MKQLRYTLLSDGSSDRGLLPILTWLLSDHLPSTSVQSEWADLRRLRHPPQTLPERIGVAIELYPCDLLFIHRDAERASREERVAEITKAQAGSPGAGFPAVCVVPVRMTEAWLLFDEAAIRRAAGNPNGLVHLALPTAVEALPNPKRVLREMLVGASEFTGRRRKKFHVSIAARNVAEHIPDFAPLRGFHAFAALEQDLQQLIEAKAW